MSHKENKCIRGTAWHATSLGAMTLLPHMSWDAGDSQSVGLRLVEEPPVVAEKSDRVFRGSGWNYVLRYARVALRGSIPPGIRDYNLGVRLVEEVDE
jgi:formylglycine-generating enzyme required for sulfatase activity